MYDVLDRPRTLESLGVPKKDPRPVGRPAIGKQVNIRLSDDLLAALEYIGAATDADLSHVIRAILAEHVSAHYDRATQIKAERERIRKLRSDE